MRKAAVICEFNPFHNGHKFLIKKIKEQYADEVICIMSGSFVQRGDVAVTDKYARAKAALQNGADMVAELPTAYALSPAPIFAENGVRLAGELGCELLCFGAENTLEELQDAQSVLDRADTQGNIAARMQAGSYYPRALSEAVGEPYNEMISRPNNILALEYIRACRKYGLAPIAIERKGAGHDDKNTYGDIASATRIREMIKNGEDSSAYTPMDIARPYFARSLESVLLYLLKTQTPDETADIAGVSEGLNHRFYRYANEYNSIEEILSAVKTKRYTMARLRRTMYAICLHITQEMQSRPVPYVRVLGVKSDKRHLIQAESLPLIVDVRRGYDALDYSAKEIFDLDIAATEALNSTRTLDRPLNEFSYGLITVSDRAK